MRTVALATTMGLAVQALSVANNLATVDDNRAVDLPGLLRFPVEGSRASQKHGPASRRRQASADLLNTDQGTQYLISLSMGTPAQDVKVAFDTGSSELWVNPDCSTAGSASSQEFCKGLGTYSASSGTAVKLGTQGGVTYGKGQVKFDYVRDTIGLGGGATIANQTFGVASSSGDLSSGILGAGPVLRGFDSAPYPMVVDSLARQGVIGARAFSVDLRSVDSPRGAVIFGGADTKKFSGTLSRSPIVVPGPDGAARYWITMDGVAVHAPDGTVKQALADGATLDVFPDTGATLGHLPADVVAAIAAGFPGAEWRAADGLYTVPCGLRRENRTVDFTFGGGGAAVIKVPFGDFLWQAGTDLCVLGVAPAPASGKTWALGDSFLRAAYVVFDQDNKNLWLAQAADCGTNLVAFGKGADAVTALRGDCGGAPAEGASPSSTTTTAAAAAAPTTASTGKPSSSVRPTASSSAGTTARTKPTSSVPASRSSGAPSSDIRISSAPAGAGGSASLALPDTGIRSASTAAAAAAASTPANSWPTFTFPYITLTTSTITSCPPVATDCSVGRVTTAMITTYATWSPGDDLTGLPLLPQPTVASGQQGSECSGLHCKLGARDDMAQVADSSSNAATAAAGAASEATKVMTAPTETKTTVTGLVTATNPSTGLISKPTGAGPVVAAASSMFRVSGAALVAAALAAFML